MSTTTTLPESVSAVLGPRYRSVEVPVRGGDLHVGVWEPAAPAPASAPVPSLVLIHGITASHVSWAELAAALPHVRLVAPDLRGRGRSRDLPGPYGMPTHADDVAAVVEALDLGRVGVVGHSMGAFVSLVLADRHPDLVTALALVDGGMPLVPPPGVEPEAMSMAVLGPAAERLRMTFPDRAAYRDFWAQHPALGPEWTDLTGAYVDYDLVGDAGAMHPSTRVRALEDDIRELVDGSSVVHALDHLRHPATWFVAPRGLMDEVPPLYPESAVDRWTTQLPQLRLVHVPDVNHYTIVMLRRGVDQLLPHLEAMLR